MKKYYFTLLLYLILTVNLFSQTITSIDSVRINDSNGSPVNAGKAFTISGIVTSTNQFGSSGPGSIQDETAGISIYGSGYFSKMNIGDSVIILGTLSSYNGLAELNYIAGSTITIISSSHQIEPGVVTIYQIINQQWNGVEEYEGKLVRINNVTISGTGNFTGGTSGYNYDISDPTGSLTQGLRIDNNVTSIIGTPIPTGKVDIIGIVSQFKTSTPYNSGYQILPRFILDIVTNSAPLILTPVLASDIDTSSFTVYFNTARNGDSKVKYGLTSSLELDSISVNEDTTIHKIRIDGLKSSTTYYYKVYSSNSKGTSESDLQSVTTASSNPTLGKINVYFNYPVDTTLAFPGNAALGKVDFKQKLIDRINKANYSIDMAVYSFQDMPDVANALVLAKNRGVKIRVVYDHRSTQNPIQNSMQSLVASGILVSQRPPDSPTLPGIMHNKFFIFDARDTIETNDWLWTGSWNVTATELYWKNNVVEINDPALTKAYQKEFEEMWGSNSDTPNSVNAKFGIQKSDNTQHTFSIGGRTINLYFSPSDGTTNKIINAINSSDHDIYFAQYTFTRNDIGDAIKSRNSNSVKDIKGIINNINDNGSEYNYLAAFADMHQNPGNVLHDKYAIIDAGVWNSDPIVITGSHNWSSAAENDNDENTLIIHDTKITNQFVQDFKQRYIDAGGSGVFIIPTEINSINKISNYNFNLFQNFPNPFNPSTTITFSIPKESNVTLKIFNILGQQVKTLVNKNEQVGTYKVTFDAAGLTSGIYFYTISTGEYHQVKKMLLVK